MFIYWNPFSRQSFWLKRLVSFLRASSGPKERIQNRSRSTCTGKRLAKFWKGSFCSFYYFWKLWIESISWGPTDLIDLDGSKDRGKTGVKSEKSAKVGEHHSSLLGFHEVNCLQQQPLHPSGRTHRTHQQRLLCYRAEDCGIAPLCAFLAIQLEIHGSLGGWLYRCQPKLRARCRMLDGSDTVRQDPSM